MDEQSSLKNTIICTDKQASHMAWINRKDAYGMDKQPS